MKNKVNNGMDKVKVTSNGKALHEVKGDGYKFLKYIFKNTK